MSSPPVLKASYTSPASSQTFAHPITAPPPPKNVVPSAESTKLKSAYLAELRLSTKKMQEEINVFLTRKMEEDKAAAATNGKAEGEKEEEREEERYGEEDVEEEG